MKQEDNRYFNLLELFNLSGLDLEILNETPNAITKPTLLYDFLRDYVIKHRYDVFEPELIKKMEAVLHLEFLPEGPTEGNVCFLQNPEVRDDFKTFFSTGDLLNYSIAVLPYVDMPQDGSLEDICSKLPFPDPNTFWKVVQHGRDLKR